MTRRGGRCISASSSSSSSCQGSSYDVFLNFRGKDTRNGFTAHLYEALCSRGIRTFMDAHKIVKGEEISPALASAMDSSMFCVVVLSKTYAYSTWCLDELVQILKCKNAKKQTVLPVFYDVDPSDVRYQKGRFAKAFAKHGKKFKEEMERVQMWKQALIEIANISGWDARNRHEPTIIKEIIQVISNGLANNTSSNEAVEKESLVPDTSTEERREVPLLSKRKINQVEEVEIGPAAGARKQSTPWEPNFPSSFDAAPNSPRSPLDFLDLLGVQDFTGSLKPKDPFGADGSLAQS